MGKLLRNWNFARVLRLVLAGAFLGAAVSSGEWIAYVVAAVFGLQAILNVGCCGSACAVPPVNRKAGTLVQDTDYEEVH
jgi:hypothetical protein